MEELTLSTRMKGGIGDKSRPQRAKLFRYALLFSTGQHADTGFDFITLPFEVA